MTHITDSDHEAETEQYDEIPWSHLVDDLGRPGPSLPLVATVVLVVGAVAGFFVASVFGGDQPAAGTQAVPTSVTSTSQAAVASVATPAPVAAPPPPGVVFAEADLMAVATDHEVRGAAARAEWFVQDYFTVDGSSETSDEVVALIDGMELSVERTATTYVEWARALVVEPLEPGRYEVVVAMRLLAADGEGFARQPARAVIVPVRIEPDLGSVVTGLPRPAALPAAEPDLPGVVDQAPPDDVMALATAEASRFGTTPIPLRSWLEDGTWHIVMSVEYAGAAWPLQIDVPQPGSVP